jgi:NAD(P)H dehydrogenase (quinone)
MSWPGSLTLATMRIVIVGGGPGGYEAALVAAEAAADVTLVSNEGLGGNSVLWDCVPSKALIVSAEGMGWMQAAHRLGVRLESGADIGARACVSMDAVVSRIRNLGLEQSEDITKKVEAAGTRLVEGIAQLDGRNAVEVHEPGGSSSRLDADIILIATGSKPRILPLFEPDGERVFTARELFGLTELPERLIVVGSGATGAEFAHAFASFGSEVHLISSRDQILPREDPDAAAVLEDVFERRGMVIHRRRRAVAQELTADGVRIDVGDGEWVEGTHVLWCVGQVPASEQLGLDGAGVAVEPSGAIPIDAVSRTNVPTVYAAGDVTGGIMLASVAAMQGRIAMWHALGRPVTPLRSDAINGTIFTEPEIAWAGLSAAEIEEAQIPFESVMLPFTGNARAKMNESTDGFVKIHAMEGSGTILGGSVVAAHASDLIAPLSVAVQNRLTVSQVANTLGIYPSMGGSVHEAARILMGRLP